MDWKWFAGFYEGEGCPTYNTIKVAHRLRLIVIQNDRRVLQWIASQTPRYNPHVWIRRNGEGRSWMLAYDGPYAVAMAKRLLPHMHAPSKIKQLRDALRGEFHKA